MKIHKRLNQKGVTLVEIILVIAIIGILAGTTVMVIGHLRYADTEKAVKTVDSSLDKLQVQSRYTVFVYLSSQRWLLSQDYERQCEQF